MAWIQIHQQLKDHRKIFAVSDSLEIEPAHAMGLIISFWLWALDNAPNGSLEGISQRSIARAAQWGGTPEDLVKSFVDAGFLDEGEEDGALKIHDWYEYAGKLVDQRESERKRAKTRRGSSEASATEQRAKDEQTPDVPRTVGVASADDLCTLSVASADVPRTVGVASADDLKKYGGIDQSKTIYIKREKNNKKRKGEPDGEKHENPPLETYGSAEAEERVGSAVERKLEEFRLHLECLEGKPVTDYKLQTVAWKLISITPDEKKRIELLDNAMQNGWKTVYEPKILPAARDTARAKQGITRDIDYDAVFAAAGENFLRALC